MQKKLSFWFQKFGFTALLLGLFLSLIVLSGCSSSSSDPAPLPLSKTVTIASLGDVAGDTVDDAWVWKGIPYAKPPVGELRWKAPVDPDPWTDLLDGSVECSKCVQQVYDSHWFSQNAFVGSEDCLYLNIYSPRTTETNLPVYVYIHGGSNNFGSAEQYNGAALAKRGNMLVVYVQYRLNAMGFLTHPALRTSGTNLDKSGNYGLLDIMKALEWVQNHIADFGGDPTKVLVGGQSAGAHDIMNLIVSPLTANFRGAFMQSVAGPGLMSLKTVAASDTWTNTTIEGLLIRDGSAADQPSAAALRASMSPAMIEAYLRGKPAELIARCRRDGTGADGTGSMAMHSAIRDGNVIPDADWVTTIGTGTYHKVPIVIGGNRYEWKDFAPLYGGVVKTYTAGAVPSGAYSWLNLWGVIGVTDLFGVPTFPVLTLNDVLPTDTDKNFYAAVTDLKSRSWRLNGVDDIVRALKANDPANVVYSYQFKWAGGGDTAVADFTTIFGAAHGMDIPFFQGKNIFAWDVPISPFTPFTTANQTGRVALQGAMMDYLISFIKTLDPNPAASTLLAWPQWDTTPGGPKLIIFDAALTNSLLAIDTNEIIAVDLAAEIAAAKAFYPAGFAMAFVVNGL